MSGSTTAPVEEGETHRLEIEEIGSEGDGIGYIEGFVIFVPDTSLGEAVDVEIETVRDTFATGFLVE